MSKIKAWLYAARLRTLPLSLAGIFMGSALAKLYGYQDTLIFILALLTTVAFQLTSNFANDYGDGVKGTDNADRIGPGRALQSGLLSRAELKSGILVSALISLALAVLLVWFAFRESNIWWLVLFIFLGIASIWAAISYTVGDRAYGYRGLGDFFVFVFFGLLSVLGSMFLFTKFLTPLSLLPAASIGMLSTAVLNLNNMRDIGSDRKAGKITLVVRMGLPAAKRYHLILICGAFLCMLVFVILQNRGLRLALPLLAFIPIFIHLAKAMATKEPVLFDPELKKLALSTFLVAILSYMLFNYFL